MGETIVPKKLRNGGVAVTTVAVVLLAPQTASAAVVSMWDMDETSGTQMRDSVGSNHGRLFGVGLGAPGVTGTGFAFNGANSIVRVRSSAGLNPEGRTFAAAVHVNLGSAPQDDTADLIRKGLSTDSRAYWKMELDPNATRTKTRARCVFKGTKTSAAVRSSVLVPLNGYVEVRCEKTASTIKVVVGGVALSRTVSVGSITNTKELTIGAKRRSEDRVFGFIDNASISKG